MTNFVRGLDPIEAMELGFMEKAKQFLKDHDIPSNNVKRENSGTKEFRVVVYVEENNVNMYFGRSDEIILPEHVVFKRID